MVSFLQLTNTTPFLFDNVIRQAVESTTLLFDSFFKVSDEKAYSYFSRLLSLTISLAQISPRRSEILQPPIFRLLVLRVDLGQDPDWDPVDTKIAELLTLFKNSHTRVAEPIDNLNGFVSEWLSRPDTPLKVRASNSKKYVYLILRQSAVMAYLKHYLQQFSLVTLNILKSDLASMPLSSSLEDLQLIIAQRQGDSMILDISDSTEEDWESLAIRSIRSGFGLPDISPIDYDNILENAWQVPLIREIKDFFSR